MTLLTLLLLLYFAGLLWFGLRGSPKETSLSGLLTTGGTTGALFCALSLVSTIIGGSATLGVGSLAQKIGPAAFWWFGVGAIGLTIHGLFVAPIIRRSGALTLPHLLGQLAGPWAEKWAGLIIAVSWIAVTAAQFTALHTLLTSVSGGMTAEVLYIFLVAGILFHTTVGGQRGVIRTDAVQTVLLLGGFAAAAIWCVSTHPEAASALPRLPLDSRFGFSDWLQLLLLVGITYVIGPDMFSRSFSAEDGVAARRAALTAAPVLIIFGVVITMLALMNHEAHQPIADWLAADSPMPGVISAVLAVALVSALSGSADTVLLSAAGIIEKDLFGQNRVAAVRLWTVVIGLASASCAWISGDIIRWLLTGYSFFVPGIAVPMLLLVLGKLRKAEPRIWLTGAVAGGLCGLIGSLTGLPFWSLAGIAAAFLGSLLAILRYSPNKHV